jgi:hypothetical protein
MLGLGLDADVRSWFEPPGRARGRRARPGSGTVPKTTVAHDLVERALAEQRRC